MSDSTPAEQEKPELSRAERRRAERAQRKWASALMTSVSRLELSQQLAPIVTAGQQHECVLSFLFEKGLVIRDGRAVIDDEEFRAWLAEKNQQAKQESASA